MLKKTGRVRGQKWTIQTHRQHWAQDTERRKTVRTTQHNTKNLNDDKYGPHAKTRGAPTCLQRVSTNFCLLLDGPQDHDNIYIVFIAAMTST